MKIFLAGHKGMVGSSIKDLLERETNYDVITAGKNKLDLRNQDQVLNFFNLNKPDYVIIAAAKVGGIYANNTYPADFIYDNLMIQSNLIHSSFNSKVKKLLFLGSSCIYPKNCKQPISEDMLLDGKLEQTNEPYAIAKIAGIKLCESFNRQFNTDFRSLMPTNLYGENDNFSEKNSHVIPGLLRRFHFAKENKDQYVKVWGDGRPKREFLHVKDLSRACIFILDKTKEDYTKKLDPMISHINIGSGQEINIKDLSNMIAKVVGYQGKIIFDKSKPNGTMRKLMDSSKLMDFGWKPQINLEEGLESTYNWFLENKIKLHKDI